MKPTIFVRFTAPGWHHWPDATHARAYLAHSHRHLFHIEVSTEVDHDDRELEFHDLRDVAEASFKMLDHGGGNLGSRSCEQIAREVGSALVQRFERSFIVRVSEDGECGAAVESRPA